MKDITFWKETYFWINMSPCPNHEGRQPSAPTAINPLRSLNAIREYIASNPVNWEQDFANPIKLEPRHERRREKTAGLFTGSYFLGLNAKNPLRGVKSKQFSDS